jgi:hypothetical protein
MRKEIDMADYIPPKDREFNDFFNYLYHYVNERTVGETPVWTFIPKEQLSNLSRVWRSWTIAWNTMKEPHTSIETEIKNEARKAAEVLIRPFVNRFLRFPPVTNEDRMAMGIPNPKEGRTPIPVPTTSPKLLPNTGTRRRLIIHYRNEESEQRGKPKDIHGIEIMWAILDHPPVDLDELIHSSFSTRSPLTLEFKEYERGCHVYMTGRWEINRDGEKGPFGAIEEVVIP